jgi:methionyl-tRNA formyltransferase
MIDRRIRGLSEANVRVIFDANDPGEVRRAKKYDLAVCAAYPQIFGQALLGAPRLGAINFHPSYLPRCRGAHPVYWTIASGEPYGGVSCHVMEATIDSGPLVARRRIDFDKNSITYSRLYELVEAETPLLCREVETFFAEERTPTAQEGPSSYFRNEREADRRVSFVSETAERASAKVRAGGAFAICMSGRMLFLSPPTSILSPREETHPAPGRVVDVRGDQILIATRDGYLVTRFAEPHNWFHKRLRRVNKLEWRCSTWHIGEMLS